MRKFIEERVVFLYVSFLLIIANISAISLNYGFSDDYTFFYNYSSNNNLDLRNMFFAIGRPINGVLLELFFSKLQLISDLRILRFLSLFGILVVLFGMHESFKRHNLSKIEMFFLLIFLFTLPSINLFICWTQYFTAPLALIFSICSALIIFKTTNKPRITIFQLVIKYFISILLLLFSSFIHQTISMYYWVIVGIILFFSVEDEIKSHFNVKFLFNFVFVWVISMALSYFWIRIFSLSYSGGGLERSILATNIFNKIIWFVYEVIIRSLNFHLLIDSKIIPIILLIVIIFGLNLFFEEHKINKITGYFVVTLLIIFSYFPNLIIEENWGSYRTQIALSSMFVLLIFISFKSIIIKLGLRNKPLIFFSIMSFFSISSLVLYSYHQIRNMTYPQSLEISFMKYQLTKFDNRVQDNIYIIQPSWNDSISSRLFGYDEFGIPSSSQAWAPEPMVRLLLREMNYDYKNIIIKYLPSTNILNFNDSDFILDLRSIREFKLID